MTARRLEIGPLIVLLGAVLLLVGLFLDWFEPGLTAWEAFEVLDLVLAAVAVLAVLAAVGAAGLDAPAVVDPRALGWSAAVALVLVIATLLNHPPAAIELDPDAGLWISLAGAALMGAGALLSLARVRVSLDVQSRRTRMSAVDARRHDDEETRPLGATDEPAGRAPRPGSAPGEAPGRVPVAVEPVPARDPVPAEPTTGREPATREGGPPAPPEQRL